MAYGARATGIANIAADGTVLDSWYPTVELIDDITHPSTRRVSANELSPRLLNLIGMDRDRHVEVVPVRTEIADLSAPAVDAHDVYLRLHLLVPPEGEAAGDQHDRCARASRSSGVDE